MLQDAFRTALQELEAKGANPHVDPRTLLLVQAAVQPGTKAPSTGSRAEWQRYMYRARRLVLRWLSATRCPQPAVRLMQELQDEWVNLTHEMAHMEPSQCATLLQEIRETLTPDQRHRPFLLRHALAHPGFVATLPDRLGCGWFSPAGYLLCLVTVLSDLSNEECDDLADQLGAHAPSVFDPSGSWLAEPLATWLRWRVHPDASIR
jgi:hypothetical protein